MIGALAIGAACVSLIVGRRLRAHDGQPTRWRPGVWLGAVAAALYVNQVLCTIYIMRVHGGDPSFIADQLPAGWFDLAAGNRLLRLVATGWPAPELLDITVLRVPALLELPFVVLAYLTVLWWADPRLCRGVVRSPLIWLASVAYSVTFSLIELSLPNQYTSSDLVLRSVAALVTPLAVRWMLRGGRPATRDDAAPASVPGVAGLLASVGALGFLVLVFYDTVLLYNLGHLAAWLPGSAVAVVVLAGARRLARWAGPPAGPTVQALIAAGRRFLVVFFVPALTIRYTLVVGSAWVGLAAATVMGAVALGGGIREVASRPARVPRDVSTRSLIARVSVCLVVGALAAAVGLRSTGAHPELTLLSVVALCALGVLGTAVLIDKATATDTPCADAR